MTNDKTIDGNAGATGRASILFIPVNYNSYAFLSNYLRSISAALARCSSAERPSVDVCIADNSTRRKPFALNGYEGLNVELRQLGNEGYLPAAISILNEKDATAYDLVIISNVDVTLAPDFFTELLQAPAAKGTAWLAPSIWSTLEKKDMNPKLLHRYAAGKLRQLKLIFSLPPLYALYRWLSGRKKSAASQCADGESIYAGHGSFIILTREFFATVGKLHYPVFLFCEEIHLAELARNAALRVEYRPRIRVTDQEHASTGQMPLARYCKYNRQAISYILKTWYE